MAKSSLEELVSMGYSETQATQALKIAGGDLEQAVGFLCLGEASQVGFNHSFIVGPNAEEMVNSKPAARPTSKSTPSDPKIQELMAMGYQEDRARQALQVSHGDMDQAVSFLLMGESRLNFVTEGLGENSNHGGGDALTEGDGSDEALAAVLQEEEMKERATARATVADLPQAQPQSTMYHATSMNQQKDAPKMVATESRLLTPGASPFCACVAAARFLTGGVVTSSFLNSILGGGVELFRKGDGDQTMTVAKVMEKYGKTHLGIEALMDGVTEPKNGIFVDHDLKNEAGVRKLLTDCRNEQREGWLVIIMELEFDSFLICLPPKGSKNKFWYIDFSPRAQFRVPGAYARVHSNLLQMQESLESIFRTLTKSRNVDFESFILYKIKRVGGQKE
mmetsp:Transcript_91458/g.136926  ORF Transcript_91458/g.136926 Transcript_91458/m.136926 type:complete len:393 (+) Transcript_91458:26-1204(+)|eukprot:CAMPEP_0117029882 /NCGR_PEP_ID=MMETSP0472-20121206/21594_1 /TAXON_ID=693140 ORGANISM="Tiarina fusus, Strain LIS" /NCGR_SAMPLE_ID=MMETSP0472 /ASSEMBLY_ACC=CAM_ASM_000603 /LENGTH=392 /DNA_ID=CAMNT_0004737759 /DNA_START=25 /DNA_END=1203 /DNA_ORIENTATION=-